MFLGLNPNWDGSGLTPEGQPTTGPWAPSSQPSFTEEENKLLTFLNQQNPDAGSAAEMLKIMAEEDSAYAELYAQLLAERENQERAYQWYEDFNSKYYQRTTKDLQEAGLNPWLALQSLGSGGSGSVSAAGTFGSSSNTISATKQKNETEKESKTIGAIGTIIAAIAGAIVMALA